MAPMCMYSCFPQDGMVDDFHVQHYGARAMGGVGLVICEATAIHPDGRISPEDAGLWEDRHIDAYARVVRAIHRGGAKAAIQLAHAGRKSQAAEKPIAPSPIAFNKSYKTPKKMNAFDIDMAARDFGAAAARALEAGFDAIEVHGAHGYLINEFLSPLTNHRKDEYGRDRLLFLDQVLTQIRSRIPSSMPLILRVSAEDWEEGGNSAESLAQALAGGILDRHGVSTVHVSTGGVVDAPVLVYPGYQIPAAETMSRILKTRVIGGGLIDSPEMAESIVQDGRADFVFLGRALLRDPHWVLRAAAVLKHDLQWPRQYQRAKF